LPKSRSQSWRFTAAHLECYAYVMGPGWAGLQPPNTNHLAHNSRTRRWFETRSQLLQGGGSGGLVHTFQEQPSSPARHEEQAPAQCILSASPRPPCRWHACNRPPETLPRLVGQGGGRRASCSMLQRQVMGWAMTGWAMEQIATWTCFSSLGERWPGGRQGRTWRSSKAAWM